MTAPLPAEQVCYQLEPDLSSDEFVDVLRRSGLAARRPVEQPATIAGMLANADVLCTARVAGKLVGVARALSDFSYCTYLSDLAVDEAFQRRGIGRELFVARMRRPVATPISSCWLLPGRGLLSAYRHDSARIALITPAFAAGLAAASRWTGYRLNDFSRIVLCAAHHRRKPRSSFACGTSAA
ncbi:MAG: GNAT family N-acetyltransferase [Planctomycetaceae bacterium]